MVKIDLLFFLKKKKTENAKYIELNRTIVTLTQYPNGVVKIEKNCYGILFEGKADLEEAKRKASLNIKKHRAKNGK